MIVMKTFGQSSLERVPHFKANKLHQAASLPLSGSAPYVKLKLNDS